MTDDRVPRRSWTPATRWALYGFGGVLLVGVVCLIVAGFTQTRATAYSVQVPANAMVAGLVPGKSICQQPLPVRSPFAGLTAWVLPAQRSQVVLAATVSRAGSGAPLAQARLTLASREPLRAVQAVSGRLSRTIASGQEISVCVRSVGPGTAHVLGGLPTAASGELVLHGMPVKSAFALVLASPHPRTIISLLPDVFTRAALFHPSWMGAWTFWALLIALIASVPLLVGSLRRAVSLDEQKPEDAPESTG